MALLRRQQLHLWLCLLLLAVAASPAPMVLASGECYKTAMKVPRWCRVEFIKAMWNDDHHGISPKCCVLLACVRDPPCFPVLRDFCVPPKWARDCTWEPPLSTSNSSKHAPAPAPGRHH
jgi:hypothetical protein